MRSCKESCSGFTSIRDDIKPCGIPKIHLIKSEWQDWKVLGSPQWPFITWRIAYLMFCAFAVTWSMSDPEVKLKHWFIFATNWTIFLQLVYSTLQMLNIILFYCVHAKGREYGQNDAQDSNFLDACIWILFTIVGVIPYIVSIGYWTAVYDPKNPPSIPVVTMCNHGVNAVFSLIDTLLVAIPVHVTHVVYLLAFSGVYATFSYLYDALGGTYPPSGSMEASTATYIYSFLNWRETPGRSLISVAVTLATVSVFFCILWLLYISRLYLVWKFTKMGAAVYDRHRRGKVIAEVAIEANGRGDEQKEYESHSVKSGELEPVDLEAEAAEHAES